MLNPPPPPARIPQPPARHTGDRTFARAARAGGVVLAIVVVDICIFAADGPRDPATRLALSTALVAIVGFLYLADRP